MNGKVKHESLCVCCVCTRAFILKERSARLARYLRGFELLPTKPDTCIPMLGTHVVEKEHLQAAH